MFLLGRVVGRIYYLHCFSRSEVDGLWLISPYSNLNPLNLRSVCVYTTEVVSLVCREAEPVTSTEHHDGGHRRSIWVTSSSLHVFLCFLEQTNIHFPPLGVELIFCCSPAELKGVAA